MLKKDLINFYPPLWFLIFSTILLIARGTFTIDLWIHHFIAYILTGFHFFIFRPKINLIQKLAIPFLLLVGASFPDWDTFISISIHRNPITHSAIIYFIGIVVTRPEHYKILHFFGLGIAAHLIVDFLNYENVIWIPGKILDLIFLATNFLIVLILMNKKIEERIQSFVSTITDTYTSNKHKPD